jgi:hypothetical protein
MRNAAGLAVGSAGTTFYGCAPGDVLRKDVLIPRGLHCLVGWTILPMYPATIGGTPQHRIPSLNFVIHCENMNQ